MNYKYFGQQSSKAKPTKAHTSNAARQQKIYLDFYNV